MTPLRLKRVLTTGQVAKVCHVASRTVSKWFDSGKLRGYRIPGSKDRRIPMEHLIEFMRSHKIPLAELDGETCRVLIIDSDIDGQFVEQMSSSGRYEIRTSAGGFETGIEACGFSPHAIVLDLSCGKEYAEKICRDVRSNPETQAIKIIATWQGENGNAEDLADFDSFLLKPYTPRQLAEAIEEVTNLVIRG